MGSLILNLIFVGLNMVIERPQIKRWRYQCKVLVHPGHEVCKMGTERPELHSLWLESHRKMLSPCDKTFEHLKNFHRLLIFPYHRTRVCSPEILQGSYGNHDIIPYKSISTARLQTPLFIKSCSRIAWICCAPVFTSFLQWSFNPFKTFFVLWNWTLTITARDVKT